MNSIILTTTTTTIIITIIVQSIQWLGYRLDNRETPFWFPAETNDFSPQHTKWLQSLLSPLCNKTQGLLLVMKLGGGGAARSWSYSHIMLRPIIHVAMKALAKFPNSLLRLRISSTTALYY
jgi:hypothetical protein